MAVGYLRRYRDRDDDRHDRIGNRAGDPDRHSTTIAAAAGFSRAATSTLERTDPMLQAIKDFRASVDQLLAEVRKHILDEASQIEGEAKAVFASLHDKINEQVGVVDAHVAVAEATDLSPASIQLEPGATVGKNADGSVTIDGAATISGGLVSSDDVADAPAEATATVAADAPAEAAPAADVPATPSAAVVAVAVSGVAAPAADSVPAAGDTALSAAAEQVTQGAVADADETIAAPVDAVAAPAA